MSNAGLSGWAEAALVLFMAAFVAIVAWTFWPSRKPAYDRASRLPLEDDAPAMPGAREGDEA
jgi:cbb3-type cytochrome oxidase subunit 3